MTNLSVFILLQTIATGNSWRGDVSLKDYKIRENEVNENKKKYLETLIILRIKWTGMLEIKNKEFKDRSLGKDLG